MRISANRWALPWLGRVLLYTYFNNFHILYIHFYPCLYLLPFTFTLFLKSRRVQQWFVLQVTAVCCQSFIFVNLFPEITFPYKYDWFTQNQSRDGMTHPISIKQSLQTVMTVSLGQSFGFCFHYCKTRSTVRAVHFFVVTFSAIRFFVVKHFYRQFFRGCKPLISWWWWLCNSLLISAQPRVNLFACNFSFCT